MTYWILKNILCNVNVNLHSELNIYWKVNLDLKNRGFTFLNLTSNPNKDLKFQLIH